MNRELNIIIYNEANQELSQRQKDIILGAIEQVGAMYEEVE